MSEVQVNVRVLKPLAVVAGVTALYLAFRGLSPGSTGHFDLCLFGILLIIGLADGYLIVCLLRCNGRPGCGSTCLTRYLVFLHLAIIAVALACTLAL